MINFKDFASRGISVLPVKRDSKAPDAKILPDGRWAKFQANIAEEFLLERWGEYAGSIGAICGAVSGNMECIDLDNKLLNADDYYKQFYELVEDNMAGLWEKLTIQSTPSGGYHFVYRCSEMENIPGNNKLAMVEGVCVFETRGEKGYFLISPAPGYKIIQGSFEELSDISLEEREFLINVAKSFGDLPEVTTQGSRAGDEFNETGDISQVLIRHDWRLVKTVGEAEFWARPGKVDGGASATFNANTNKLQRNKFYVFSSNASPFEAGVSYSKFSVLALLDYGGRYQDAARALGERGFGSMPKSEAKVNQQGKVVRPKPKGDDVEPNEVKYIETYLKKFYKLRYNLVKGRTEITEKDKDDFRFLEDREMNDIWRKMKSSKKISFQALEAILKSYFVEDFDPFCDYFEKLPDWDGHGHIERFCDLFQVAEGQKERFENYFTRWFIGVVACSTGRGVNHNCLVLVGGQGIGKTTILNKLCPDTLKKYLAVAQINPNDKDSKLLAVEAFIINLDELESSTREEVGHLKSLITTKDVSVRKAYGRNVENYKRRASFCGSVNRAQFLNDITGSRRFLVVDVEGIDLKAEFDVDQMYAQALRMLEDGVKYWFDNDEITQISNINSSYSEIDAEEELLLTKWAPYMPSDSSTRGLKRLQGAGTIELKTATDIYSDIASKFNGRLSLKKLGLILKKCGFVQVSVKEAGAARRLYVLKPAGNTFGMEPDEPF